MANRVAGHANPQFVLNRLHVGYAVPSNKRPTDLPRCIERIASASNGAMERMVMLGKR